MTAQITPVTGAPCVSCGQLLVSERGASPWCATCGWNIDCYEPERRRPEFGWRLVDRLTFRTAYELNARQFAALSGRDVDRIGFSWVKVLLTAITLVLLALLVGLAAVGAWLIVSIGGFLGYLFGLIVLGIAFVSRPRLGRRSKHASPVPPDAAPTLHRLIAEVAAATGAPTPHEVICSSAYNASSSAYGLRRRRVLSIGLPLWASLTAPQQVALLGHELGHFVNGDVRRGPLTSMAFTTLRTWSELTRPGRTTHRYRRGDGGVVAIAEFFVTPLMWLIHLGLAGAQVVVEWVALRATHTAEYEADQLAARTAGSEAATGLLDMLMFQDECTTVLRRAARTSTSAADWRQAVDQSRPNLAARTPRMRQLSMRDQASLYRSHPPAGLRAQMITSRVQVTAKVELSTADSDRIDQELAGYYKSVRTELIN